MKNSECKNKGRNSEITKAFYDSLNLGYESSFMRNKLAIKYELSPRTIRGIVSGEYDKRKESNDTL